MTGLLLSTFGHSVTLTDMDDWRDQRAEGLPFERGKIEAGLPFESERFDFVFSFETFEHVENPTICLEEVRRVCRPGGKVFLLFGPLYASAWGLHAFSTLKMPYPQFLFSDAFLHRKIEQIGVYDLGRLSHALQPLNKWRLADYVKLWSSNKWTVEEFEACGPSEFLNLVFQYPEAFWGRGLTYDDLVSQSIRLEIKRC
jgi:SAM-dependent methyltransferase